METNTVIQQSSFWKRPLQFEGTPLLPNVLLMCKLIVLLLLAHHIFAKIEDPFIPFIPALDIFHTIPNLFKLVLRSLLVISVTTLFFNFYVRTSVIVIGSIVILSILASKPDFYNHTFICGCALFLSGLTNNKQPPYLLFLQLGLVYFGASINKIFDADWWSGAFMHNWLAVARENPFYLLVSKWFPHLWFAKFLSWTAISTEFIIAFMVISKKYRNFGIWFIIIFHTILFTMTSFRYGHFIESLALILLAFLAWPKGNMLVEHKPNAYHLFRKIMRLMDWDKKIIWKEKKFEDNSFIELTTQTKKVTNDVAIKDIILYTPAFYIILVVSDMVLYVILYNHRTTLFVLNAITIWALIIYFLPINWSNYFNKKETTYK
ncbi:MAG: HTTM domain-containing protein [Gelidibacter sp.]|nr:HTTM domain-containing protein [Gelidibacter sp.]